MTKTTVLCMLAAALATTSGASAGEPRSGFLCAEGAHVAFVTWGEGSEATLGVVELRGPLGKGSFSQVPLGEPGPVKLACEGGRVLVGTAAGILEVSSRRPLEVSETDRAVDFDTAVVDPIGCAHLKSSEAERVELSVIPDLPLGSRGGYTGGLTRERFAVGTRGTEREAGGTRVETEVWMRAGEIYRVVTLLDTVCPPGGTVPPGEPPPGGGAAGASPATASR